MVTDYKKISNTVGILTNTDGIFVNTDGILSNTDGILTLHPSSASLGTEQTLILNATPSTS